MSPGIMSINMAVSLISLKILSILICNIIRVCDAVVNYINISVNR